MGVIKIAIGIILVSVIIKAYDMFLEDCLSKIWQRFLGTSIYSRYTSSSKVVKWIIGILSAFMVVIAVSIYLSWIQPSFENKTKDKGSNDTVQTTSSEDVKVDGKVKVVNPKVEELTQMYIDTQEIVNKIAISATEGNITTEEAERLIKAVNENSLKDTEIRELILILKEDKTSTE